jgi:hypothetical protein
MDLKKMTAYLESPEGKESTRLFFESWFYPSRKGSERISKMIKDLSDEELEKWMEKFLIWEEKWEDMQYHKRHVETDSLLFNSLYEFVRQNGININGRYDEDFLASADEWRGYTFKLYQGQGCFYRIERKGELIFQSN